MGRIPLYALIWSEEQRLYELYTRGQLKLRLRPAEEAAWLAWLGEVSSFAFYGKGGSLNVYQEPRPRGGAYWYAYHTTAGRIRKRYLGRTGQVTMARLEETAQAFSDVHASSPAPEPEVALLKTKLTPPRLPRMLVARPRLLSLLDETLATPMALLSASAGWGKTTVLSAWAQQHQEHVAWLSLDELDNSPTRFWVALIAALRRSASTAPDLGEKAIALLQSPQPPPIFSVLIGLLQELERAEAQPAPLVLIVDDYQMIEEPVIHEGLSFWMEHLPAHLHLILASRVDPNLPLVRWRARGSLTEIRMDELRFSLEEASQFLHQLLVEPLAAEEVQQLALRTEGWIAGLQLAALALQKRADRAAFLQALTGSQRYLLDYVQEEILARLPAEARDFLLQVAILSRLDAEVCQAVTAAPTKAASQQLLVFLEHANLFLVPLDEERRSYRLHDLFSEALLAALDARQPELVPLLHRRAASFYEGQEQWAEAIAHRLAAEDFSAAARLMEQTAEPFWVRGEASTMAKWVLALPQSLVREHARLMLTMALYLLYTVTQTTREQRTRVHQQVRHLMSRVETALRRETVVADQEPSATPSAAEVAAEEALLHRRLGLLRLYLVFMEATANGDDARRNRMQPEIEEALSQDEEAIWYMVLLTCSFVLSFSVLQEGARLLPQLLEARERVSRSGSHFASLKVRQFLAVAALEAGQLRLAAEESQAALDLIEQIAGFALLKGYFEIVLARVWYQWNRLEEARGLLHTVVQDAAAWQHLDVLGWGHVSLMQVELARGDGSRAELSLHEVEHLVQRERYGTYPGGLPTLRAQWWLAQGKLQEASDWAASVIFPEGAWGGSVYGVFPVVIRVYFAQCRWREALALLERWSGHLDRPGNIVITLTFLAQYLVALHQAGRTEEARSVAARLFALTEPEGYLRVYLDEGKPMRQALLAWRIAPSEQHEVAPSTAAYVSRLLAAFDEVPHGARRSLDTATPAAPALVQPPSPASSSLLVSLTPREHEVLRLLAEGASNQEIAQRLVISLETVKKHVRNLLSKLGATNRTQAVAQARTRALL